MNSKITSRQFISLCVLFMITSVQVINVYPNSKINIWFAAISGAIGSIPVLLMFARLSGLYPDDNIFGITEKVTGKFFGKIFCFLYTMYAIYIGAVILRYLTEFIQVASMNETPQWILLIFFGTLCGYIIFKGPNILAKLSTLILPIVFAIFIFIIFCSFGFYDYSNLRPGSDESIASFSDAALSIASFSFGEVLFTINFLKKTDCSQRKKYSLFLISLILGTAFIVIQLLSNQLILGTNISSILYFPNYEAVSIINVGDFITHIEVISIISFLLCVLVKESVCIFSISEGTSSLTGLKKRNSILLFSTAAVITGGYFAFGSTMDMFKFHSINKYIVLIFQVIIPFVIYSVAEIKNIISRSRNTINEQKTLER